MLHVPLEVNVSVDMNVGLRAVLCSPSICRYENQYFYRALHTQRMCIARYMLWRGVHVSQAGVLYIAILGTKVILGLSYTVL